MKSIITSILAALILSVLPGYLCAEEIMITAVGDVMLAGRWASQIRHKGYDHPFAGVTTWISGSDIALANLESPIASTGEEFTEKKFRFRAEPPVAQALRTAGFNLVTLANNHSMDFGGAALLETLRHLNDNGIKWIGAGRNLAEARTPALFSVKGKTIAFLGYSLTQPPEFFAGGQRPGTAPGYRKMVQADVAAARARADYVIVSFHWGKEAISTVQGYQRETAHAAIDAGADIIIGHHPHILQGIERYKSGIIFYSLGNFAFASKSTTADISALIRIRLDGSRREAEVVPLDVLHRRVGFQPHVLTGSRGTAVIDRLNVLSEPFATKIQDVNGRYAIPF